MGTLLSFWIFDVSTHRSGFLCLYILYFARLTKVQQLEIRSFSLVFVEILACLHVAVGGNRLGNPAV